MGKIIISGADFSNDRSALKKEKLPPSANGLVGYYWAEKITNGVVPNSCIPGVIGSTIDSTDLAAIAGQSAPSLVTSTYLNSKPALNFTQGPIISGSIDLFRKDFSFNIVYAINLATQPGITIGLMSFLSGSNTLNLFANRNSKLSFTYNGVALETTVPIVVRTRIILTVSYSYTRKELKVYYNGVLNTIFSNIIIEPISGTLILGGTTNYTVPFIGPVGMLSIYNKELVSSEVTSQYNYLNLAF